MCDITMCIIWWWWWWINDDQTLKQALWQP